MCQVEQSACPYAVDALFVLLNLLESQSKLFGKSFLAHAKQYAAQAHSTSHMGINWIRSSRTLLDDVGFAEYFLLSWHLSYAHPIFTRRPLPS